MCSGLSFSLRAETDGLGRSAKPITCSCCSLLWTFRSDLNKWFHLYLVEIKCDADQQYELDRNHIDILGTCSYSYGEKCKYRCHTGYFSSRSLERMCTYTGDMDQTLPECQG